MTTQKVKIAVKVLPHGEGLTLPPYATADAAGCDLMAAITEPVTLQPGERKLIPTGIAMAIPPGYEGQIRGRSGLALKQGLVVAHGVGTIDADYRGELGAIMLNVSDIPVTVERGMRIAQYIIAPIVQAEWEAVNELPETGRGTGGWGSTGTK